MILLYCHHVPRKHRVKWTLKNRFLYLSTNKEFVIIKLLKKTGWPIGFQNIKYSNYSYILTLYNLHVLGLTVLTIYSLLSNIPDRGVNTVTLCNSIKISDQILFHFLYAYHEIWLEKKWLNLNKNNTTGQSWEILKLLIPRFTTL